MRGLRRLVAVLRDAAPLMLAELMPSLAGLVDMWFVRGLGPSSVDGVGVGGYVYWLASVPLIGVYTGVLVAVSQALGAGERSRAERIASESMGLGVLVAALSALLLWPTAEAAAGLLAAHGEAAAAAAAYLRARLPGMPGTALFYVLDAAHRAAGSNRAVMNASAAMTVVNIVLDSIAVGVLGMGVAGVGLATAASEYTAALLLALWLPAAGLRARPAPPGGEALLVARLGAPTVVERGLFSLGHGVYLSLLGRCGLEVQTAHVIGVRIESIAFLPGFALSTYASSVVGSLVGAGKIREAKEEAWRIAKASAAFMALMGLLLAAASPLASAAFSPDPRVERLVVLYLLLAAATEPALGVVLSLAGAIRGAGDTRTPTIVNLVFLYVTRVALGAPVPELFSGACCAAAAWLLMDLDVTLRALVFTWLHRSRFERLARRVV